MFGYGEDDLAEEVEKLPADLAKTPKELIEAQSDVSGIYKEEAS